MFAIAAAALAGSKKQITIEDITTQRPPSAFIAPIWAPSGNEFACQQKDVVYLYDIANKSKRDWFDTTKLNTAKNEDKSKPFGWQNRRVSSDSYQWFPDGKDLLAVVDGAVYTVHRDGSHDQIAPAEMGWEDPKLSPDGKRILYRKHWNLYTFDITAKTSQQLTSDGTATLMNGQLDWVYPEELDLGTATWWSPDSKYVAYLQFNIAEEFVYPQLDLLGRRALSEPQRYPQAGTPNARVKLGVVSAQGRGTRWMDVGGSSDVLLARVAWLPDSSQVAVERFARVQNVSDLILCNAQTGAGYSILHETSQTWLNPADNLFFLKSRSEFIWTSERSGFRHIYRYATNGELLAQITNGPWEASAIMAIDEAKQRIFYASSETSPLESQLYSVGFEGGQRTRLTPTGFSHAIQANTQGTYFLDYASSVRRPLEGVLRDSEGKRVDVLAPADMKILDRYDILPTEFVQVKAPDGTILYARLIRPANFNASKKYPAIVYVYGGPGVQSVRNAWYGVDWEQALANRGYVVWQLDNRGSKGRGRAFEAPIYHEMGKQEVADQRLGVEHLISMGFVDRNRIGVTGWSYGGYMTIRCLLLAPDVFKVGVAGAPVTDWHNYDTIYTERYMGLPDENPQGYNASSNVESAGQLKGKLLIVHNVEDDNVLFQNTMQMVNALEKADKEYWMELYPQKTHGVTGPLRKPMYTAMTDFFDEHLKNAR